MPMHDPPHPGEIIRDACLDPLGLSVTAAAKWLGVSRQSLSELAERPHRRLRGNGHPAREGRLELGGVLASKPNLARPLAGAAARGYN